MVYLWTESEVDLYRESENDRHRRNQPWRLLVARLSVDQGLRYIQTLHGSQRGAPHRSQPQRRRLDRSDSVDLSPPDPLDVEWRHDMVQPTRRKEQRAQVRLLLLVG